MGEASRGREGENLGSDREGPGGLASLAVVVVPAHAHEGYVSSLGEQSTTYLPTHTLSCSVPQNKEN
eukprot:2896790-Rhodomonas_salina.1